MMITSTSSTGTTQWRYLPNMTEKRPGKRKINVYVRTYRDDSGIATYLLTYCPPVIDN